MPNTVSSELGFAGMSASEMILTKTVHPCQFQVRLLFQNCWMSSTRISQELHNTFKSFQPKVSFLEYFYDSRLTLSSFSTSIWELIEN